MLREICRFYYRLTGRALGYGTRVKCDKQLFGNWWLCSDLLASQSIIYSCGVGLDISFDLSVIEKLGCHVYAFDPTPKSITFLETQNLPPEFHFFPWGIAGIDGEGDLIAPPNPNGIHHSLYHQRSGTGSIKVPLRRVPTIMGEMGHQRVDVLKLDIEGAEYDVIPDVMAAGIRPVQIVVEFHHRFDGIGEQKTKEVIDLLIGCGYAISYIYNWRGREMSFLWQEKMPC